jgi:hypothetical protein
MTAPRSTHENPSLVGITVRRASVTGRFFLLYGTGASIFFGVVLGASGGTAFSSSFPLVLPIFGVTGSMGALVVFTNDRVKGVLEYLLAYGVSPRRLFASVLLATLTLTAIVLAFALGAGVGVYVARGHAISPTLALTLGIYTVPMSFAAAAFAATVGIFWTTLSSPRAGMSSPVGMVPMIGILPPLATLGGILALAVSGLGSTTNILILMGAAIGLLTAVVVTLLAMTGRLLRRERLLSPA